MTKRKNDDELNPNVSKKPKTDDVTTNSTNSEVENTTNQDVNNNFNQAEDRMEIDESQEITQLINNFFEFIDRSHFDSEDKKTLENFAIKLFESTTKSLSELKESIRNNLIDLSNSRKVEKIQNEVNAFINKYIEKLIKAEEMEESAESENDNILLDEYEMDIPKNSSSEKSDLPADQSIVEIINTIYNEVLYNPKISELMPEIEKFHQNPSKIQGIKILKMFKEIMQAGLAKIDTLLLEKINNAIKNFGISADNINNNFQNSQTSKNTLPVELVRIIVEELINFIQKKVKNRPGIKQEVAIEILEKIKAEIIEIFCSGDEALIKQSKNIIENFYPLMGMGSLDQDKEVLAEIDKCMQKYSEIMEQQKKSIDINDSKNNNNDTTLEILNSDKDLIPDLKQLIRHVQALREYTILSLLENIFQKWSRMQPQYQENFDNKFSLKNDLSQLLENINIDLLTNFEVRKVIFAFMELHLTKRSMKKLEEKFQIKCINNAFSILKGKVSQKIQKMLDKAKIFNEVLEDEAKNLEEKKETLKEGFEIFVNLIKDESAKAVCQQFAKEYLSSSNQNVENEQESTEKALSIPPSEVLAAVPQTTSRLSSLLDVIEKQLITIREQLTLRQSLLMQKPYLSEYENYEKKLLNGFLKNVFETHWPSYGKISLQGWNFEATDKLLENMIHMLNLRSGILTNAKKRDSSAHANIKMYDQKSAIQDSSEQRSSFKTFALILESLRDKLGNFKVVYENPEILDGIEQVEQSLYPNLLETEKPQQLLFANSTEQEFEQLRNELEKLSDIIKSAIDPVIFHDYYEKCTKTLFLDADEFSLKDKKGMLRSIFENDVIKLIEIIEEPQENEKLKKQIEDFINKNLTKEVTSTFSKKNEMFFEDASTREKAGSAQVFLNNNINNNNFNSSINQFEFQSQSLWDKIGKILIDFDEYYVGYTIQWQDTLATKNLTLKEKQLILKALLEEVSKFINTVIEKPEIKNEVIKFIDDFIIKYLDSNWKNEKDAEFKNETLGDYNNFNSTSNKVIELTNHFEELLTQLKKIIKLEVEIEELKYALVLSSLEETHEAIMLWLESLDSSVKNSEEAQRLISEFKYLTSNEKSVKKPVEIKQEPSYTPTPGVTFFQDSKMPELVGSELFEIIEKTKTLLKFLSIESPEIYKQIIKNMDNVHNLNEQMTSEKGKDFIRNMFSSLSVFINSNSEIQAEDKIGNEIKDYYYRFLIPYYVKHLDSTKSINNNLN